MRCHWGAMTHRGPKCRCLVAQGWGAVRPPSEKLPALPACAGPPLVLGSRPAAKGLE